MKTITILFLFLGVRLLASPITQTHKCACQCVGTPTLSGSFTSDSTITVSANATQFDSCSFAYRWGTSPDSAGTITWLTGHVSDTFKISSSLSGLYPVSEITPISSTGDRIGEPLRVWGSEITTNFIIPIAATGDGTGVATIALRITDNTQSVTMVIDGNGKFYDDSGGTTNEGTTRTITAGAMRSFYLKVSSGSCNITIKHYNNMRYWGATGTSGWVASTNAPTTSATTASLPRELIQWRVTGNNTCSGDVADLPRGLIVLYVEGSNTLSGNTTGLPINMEYIRLLGSNTLAGVLGSVVSNVMTNFYVGGNSTISDDIADLPATVTYVRITSTSSQCNDYTSGRTWATGMNYVYQRSAAGYGLSATEVDNLLIDLSQVTWSGSSRTCDLRGYNAGRTSASDAAVAALQAQSVTVQTN